MIDVRLQERNLKTVVEPYRIYMSKKIKEPKINPPIIANNIFFDLKI